MTKFLLTLSVLFLAWGYSFDVALARFQLAKSWAKERFGKKP